MLQAVLACSTLVTHTSHTAYAVAHPTAYAQFVNRQRSNLAVWDLVIGPAVESQRRRSWIEIEEARAASEAAIIVVERAAARDAALALAASAAAERAAAERAAAERAAAERAAAEEAAAEEAAAEEAAASTLFNVAMPPLPPQQGGARLLLREDMGIEEQDASLSASRPTGGSIWPCAAALCRWLGNNTDAVRPRFSPPPPSPHPRPRPGCIAGCIA